MTPFFLQGGVKELVMSESQVDKLARYELEAKDMPGKRGRVIRQLVGLAKKTQAVEKQSEESKSTRPAPTVVH